MADHAALSASRSGDDDPEHVVEFWLAGAGSPVVDNDNGRGDGEITSATLDGNPEALELFEWLAAMIDDGLLEPVPGTPGQIDQ